MALSLVSEARPIPWNQLSEPEQKQLREADGWIEDVVNNAKREKSVVNGIAKNRSGRVLFIDGPRGAGKTSLLLTLLDRWTGKVEERKKDEKGPCNENLRVLLPVLDFDPLPRGMPLHGWLLEPWRKEAKDLEAKGPRGGGGNFRDLSEMWANVFERAVIGWTQATVQGQGVVERAIAYQEQASGWIDTHKEWHEFVNAAVCRSVGCLKDNCPEGHSRVFVIAIDDVDLQVEQVPRLLHAIRLLHHPNVVYVLTGNYKHLKLVLELDYIGRHEQLTHTHRYRERRSGDELWDKIKESSRDLSDALLEKALPRHARLTLNLLSAHAVLDLSIGNELPGERTGETKHQKVREVLADEWTAIAEKALDLPIATARRAQHSIDRHMGHSRGANTTLAKEDQLKFVADLCGTTIEPKDGKQPYQFALRGRITTRFGAVLRVWEGDRLKIMLTDRPRFAFLPDFNEVNTRSEEANRAVVIQLAVEKGLADALNLAWSPDAGVAATEVRWQSNSTHIEGRAIFRWPWLVKPTASQVLDLGKVAQNMSNAANDDSRSRLDEKMFVIWLSRSIEWRHAQQNIKGHKSGPCKSFEDIAERLGKLCDHGGEVRTETIRWVGELIVMTAPYFGLPTPIADKMRQQLALQKIMPTRAEINREQRRMVKDAIIVGQPSFAYISRNQLDGNNEPSSPDFDAAVDEFLKMRKAVSQNSGWWDWLKRGIAGSQSEETTATQPKPGTKATKRAPPKDSATENAEYEAGTAEKSASGQ